MAEASVTKVRVHFHAVGGAPIMKKNKFLVNGDDTFYAIQRFLRKMLKLTDADPLFLFVNNAFCPCPDERIKHLFECFQVSNELEVSYQIAGAWG